MFNKKLAFLLLLFLAFGQCRPARTIQQTASRTDSTVQRTEASAVQYSRLTTLETDFVPLTYAVRVPVVIRDTVREYRVEYRTKMVPGKTREIRAETGTQQQAKTETKAVAVQMREKVEVKAPPHQWPWGSVLAVGMLLGAGVVLFMWYAKEKKRKR